MITDSRDETIEKLTKASKEISNLK